MTIIAAVDSPADGDALAARLRRVAEEVAREAGDPLKGAFRAAMEVDYKVDLHDPVTVHDRRTEALIRDRLLGEVPDSAFLGEEGGEIGSGPVKWLVDPIDGTSNFAAGLAFWCVSIGAVADGRILAGVVYDPMTGNLFSADLDGVWLNGEPLVPRPAREEARAALITGFPVQRDFRLDGRETALADFGELVSAFSTLRRPGSAALTLCHVAAGWTDAAVGFGVNAWDVTAAILVLRQAGGHYRPLTLGKVPDGSADQLCPGYVAHGPGATYPTLDRVADRIDARRRARAA
ncbi:inositol monophosphatase family protein [Wenxinia marina]|uniref:Archaeal fructose-1,6-bisphosphatase n=1 Tax=Wenxinia marina DSM 24838 TaxID=1123501 RepID=A0A0D0PG01_9RHOB|nr:inositol monophosphatase [Wenxinia marina]KIQ70241.1 Archaeal fructose-1,6-bisphosphatase [Wenxinia marina DSM 24838]GGL50064.1 inositol phosphatase [Wenxinia marina]